MEAFWFGIHFTWQKRPADVLPLLPVLDALFAADRAPEVVRAFRDVMNGAPEDLSLACAFLTAPADDEAVPRIAGVGLDERPIDPHTRSVVRRPCHLHAPRARHHREGTLVVSRSRDDVQAHGPDNRDPPGVGGRPREGHSHA